MDLLLPNLVCLPPSSIPFTHSHSRMRTHTFTHARARVYSSTHTHTEMHMHTAHTYTQMHVRHTSEISLSRPNISIMQLYCQVTKAQ